MSSHRPAFNDSSVASAASRSAMLPQARPPPAADSARPEQASSNSKYPSWVEQYTGRDRQVCMKIIDNADKVHPLGQGCQVCRRKGRVCYQWAERGVCASCHVLHKSAAQCHGDTHDWSMPIIPPSPPPDMSLNSGDFIELAPDEALRADGPSGRSDKAAGKRDGFPNWAQGPSKNRQLARQIIANADNVFPPYSGRACDPCRTSARTCYRTATRITCASCYGRGYSSKSCTWPDHTVPVDGDAQ
jgi:hypothetical protein